MTERGRSLRTWEGRFHFEAAALRRFWLPLPVAASAGLTEEPWCSSDAEIPAGKSWDWRADRAAGRGLNAGRLGR